MPFATFSRIREVSSEDEQHLAENLIKLQQGKKWKTKNVGERLAYVILEMNESAQITGIDIGNEHSAFVEVLVGKSTCPADFTEILITCSFMTPIESKSSNNANRVRCFNGSALVPSVAEKKWSLVKVICTQPFNKHVQYGLSFIKVHIAQSQSATQKLLPTIKTIACTENESSKVGGFHLGKFKLREDSPDSENDETSSLFCRWKKSKDDKVEITTAASIRIASSKIATQTNRVVLDKPKAKSSNESKTGVLDRNRDVLLFGETDDAVESERELRLAKEIEADKERRRVELLKQAESKRKEIRRSVDTQPSTTKPAAAVPEKKNVNVVKTPESASISKNLTNTAQTSIGNIVKKRPSSPTNRPPKKTKNSETKFRPFNQLLRGVVLVISGIQNPDRGDLRNKALALGAKYKGDWDNTCTHLICAFKNTPKYNQVRGKGKIITRKWIEKCYQLKKYLPWRRYALDSNDLGKPESDEEIFDESLQTDIETPTVSKRATEDYDDTLSLYDLDEQSSATTKRRNVFVSSSESDTDDEIQRVKRKNNINNGGSRSSLSQGSSKEAQKSVEKERRTPENKSVAKSDDIYDASTDEETYLQSKQHQLNSLILS